MCDCEISVGITEVPLLHGETVLKDFQGEGGCCGVSCECCPKEYGRLTNRRIIVLQKRTGVLHSTARLEDVTACAVGRKRPNWWAILSLFITGISLVGVFSRAIDVWNASQRELCEINRIYDSYQYSEYDAQYWRDDDCDRPVPDVFVIMVVLGLIMMGLAVFIYFARPTTITFFVKGATDSNNGFSLVMASRGLAMELLGKYFAAKDALNRFEPVNVGDLHCARVATWACSANDSTVALVTAGPQKWQTRWRQCSQKWQTRWRQCTDRRDTWIFSQCKAP